MEDIGAEFTLDYLNGKLDLAVKNAGRNTMYENAQQDTAPVRYARIADSLACDFCKMLSSRGFVYVSKQTAGNFREFHPHCNCQIAVAFNVGIENHRKLQWRDRGARAASVTSAYRVDAEGNVTKTTARYRGATEVRGYTINNNSVRGTAYEEAAQNPEQVNKVVDKYDNLLDDGKITQAEHDAHVQAAREAFANYDPDALYEEYKSWSKSFKPSQRRAKSLTKNQRTLEMMKSLTDEYTTMLENATSTESLNEIWTRVCESMNRGHITTPMYEQLRDVYRASKYAAFKMSA